MNCPEGHRGASARPAATTQAHTGDTLFSTGAPLPPGGPVPQAQPCPEGTLPLPLQPLRGLDPQHPRQARGG